MKGEKKALKERLRNEIELPDGVSASASGKLLLVKGPKGEVVRLVKQHSINVRIDGKKVIIESGGATKKDKKFLGSTAAHIKNMIRGSMDKHFYTLKICSGHFPMNVSVVNSKLVVKNILGEKVPRVLQLKDGADVRVEGELIYVSSISKEKAGQVAADIEQLTRRPGYDTRIFQDGCYIINKDGKELK